MLLFYIITNGIQRFSAGHPLSTDCRNSTSSVAHNEIPDPPSTPRMKVSARQLDPLRAGTGEHPRGESIEPTPPLGLQPLTVTAIQVADSALLQIFLKDFQFGPPIGLAFGASSNCLFFSDMPRLTSFFPVPEGHDTNHHQSQNEAGRMCAAIQPTSQAFTRVEPAVERALQLGLGFRAALIGDTGFRHPSPVFGKPTVAVGFCLEV